MLAFDLLACDRPGGRCWTIRAVTPETEIGGETQVCCFTNGNLINGGPMRLLHHHTTTLDYRREFGLPLVPFTNFNTAAFVHRSGQPR
ncbi:MAG: FAD-dependent oxidoreductase [Candidatus Didemnitutus sp.]|nr:FAD-dependent oxidoreductase [Candidatus Didemnitutus sp.]